MLVGEDWYPQDLAEPTDNANPIVGGHTASYTIGSRVYAFSRNARKWAVLDVPLRNGLTIRVSQRTDNLEISENGHLYRFDAEEAKWSDIDIDPRKILDAPEDKPGNPENRPPQPSPSTDR